MFSLQPGYVSKYTAWTPSWEDPFDPLLYGVRKTTYQSISSVSNSYQEKDVNLETSTTQMGQLLTETINEDYTLITDIEPKVTVKASGSSSKKPYHGKVSNHCYYHKML